MELAKTEKKYVTWDWKSSRSTCISNSISNCICCSCFLLFVMPFLCIICNRKYNHFLQAIVNDFLSLCWSTFFPSSHINTILIHLICPFISRDDILILHDSNFYLHLELLLVITKNVRESRIFAMVFFSNIILLEILLSIISKTIILLAR